MSEEQLKKLMASARRERAPRVDVTDRVMARVRFDRREDQVSLRPLIWVAAGAAAVAIPAGAIGLDLWGLLTDPLLGLASEAIWWML
jgi:hypothetical protein